MLRQKQLVPEHIEKRTLYNPVTPGVPQVHVNVYSNMCTTMHGTSLIGVAGTTLPYYYTIDHNIVLNLIFRL